MKKYTQKKISNFLIKFLPLAQVAILASCSLNGLNQISAKTIKNEVTGEVEEYRSIKISDDEENDYFLEVKIPKDHRQVSWRRVSNDNAILDEFLPKTSYDTEYISNFRISMELYPKKSLHEYLLWRGSHIHSVYKPHRELLIHDLPEQNDSNLPLKFPHSATITHQMACLPRLGIICLPWQEEINIVKAYEGKTTFWTVEFSKVIPGNISQLEKDQVADSAELTMRNCCKITVVKKPEKNHQ